MVSANHRLFTWAFVSVLAVCYGSQANNSDTITSSITSVNINLDASDGRRSALFQSKSGRPWWKAAVLAMTNRRPKRQLSENINHVDKPHFIPDVQEHRFLEYGNYVDPTFNCPATTTCPLICVNSADDCPSDATCAQANPDSDHEFELCKDGTCADTSLNESCDPSLESPCECSELAFTCAKQVDFYDSCHSRWHDYYVSNNECIQSEEESLYELQFRPVTSKLLYIPIIVVTVLMFIWCAYNQRLNPVEKSTDVLESHDGENNEEQWIQTGYRKNFAGLILYGLVMLLHLEFQVLLLYFSIEYYLQDVNEEGGSRNEATILMAFELTWMVGFFWCFLLKYPQSIYSLFLRRSLPMDATHIAVTAPVKRIDTLYKETCIANCFGAIKRSICRVLNFIFSLESNQTNFECKTTYCEVISDPRTATRYFYFRMRRYVYDDRLKRYRPGYMDIAKDTSIGKWLDKNTMEKGLSMSESTWRLGIVGENCLHMSKPTLLKSIIREFHKPFYLYQNYMVWTWVPLYYWYMAISQTVVRIAGGIIVAVFNYMSDMDLYRLTITEGTSDVIRDGDIITIDVRDVVPGDIVRLAPGYASFDMAILKSNHIVVDEAGLTGEVNPIAKTPLDPLNLDAKYDPVTNRTSTIFAGTSILECGSKHGLEGDFAIVVQTGSFTAKGNLLSSVLSYERHIYKFHREIKLVLLFLIVEAIILVSVTVSIIEGHWVYAWFYGMFVLGTVIPPLLPTVFVVSVGISCRRLQAKRITCTDPESTMAAGKINRAFFDKTGTLTEQGLRFISAKKGDGVALNRIGENQMEPLLQLGLAVCHTLTLSETGDLIGPAVDREAFRSIPSAQLLANGDVSLGGVIIKSLRRFDFDHHSTTQSVIVEYGGECHVFVKGSPDAISNICKPSSLPANFEVSARNSARNCANITKSKMVIFTSSHFARHRMYQLAIGRSVYAGSKNIDEVQRPDIERDLIFTGSIDFQNPLKQEASQVISELKEGNVDTVIVTGDSVLTGVFVARTSGIIPPKKNVIVGMKICGGKIEWTDAIDDSPAANPLLSITDNTVLALTGEVWEHLLQTEPQSVHYLGKHIAVFGRCNPTQKVSVVSNFIAEGDVTLMCGDGGNDCGALSTAHIGVALSNTEASVVAPFTSVDKKITSVTDILREGRCALASSLASYKYMIQYGQVETINQVANAYFNITFSEWCWVFMDGFWPISMAFSLPLSKAAVKLGLKRPTASILGPHTLFSACGVLAINFLFLALALVILHHQDWYQCRKWTGEDISLNYGLGDNYESSTIFIVTGYQYIASGAAYNFGYTYRRGWFKNYVFLFFFCTWTAFQFAATLGASSFSCIWRLNCDNDHVVRSVVSGTYPINNPWNTTVMPASYRGILVGIMLANLMLVCLYEYIVVNKALFKSNAKKQDSIDAESASKEVDLEVAFKNP